METPKIELPPAHQIDQEENRRRNAYRISITTGIVMGLASIFLIVYYISIFATLERYRTVGVTLTVMTAGWLSAWLCRRNNHKIGVIILIGSIYIGSLALPFILDGQGVQFAVMIILLVAGIASVTLTGRIALWVVLGGVGLAIYNILLDFYGPAYAQPGNVIVTGTITVAVMLVYAGVIFRQYRRFSLRTKLIVAFVLVALIPLIIMTGINSWQLSGLLQGEAERALAASSRQVTNALDLFINDQLNIIYVETQLPGIRDYLLLPASDRPGSQNEAETRQVLKLLKRKKSALTRSYALLDSDGRNVLDSEESNIGRSEKNQNYFSIPLDSGLPYVSGVLFDRQGASINFSAPVWDQKGKIIGILREQFNAQIIYNTVKTASNQFDLPEIYTILVDNKFFITYAHSLDIGFMYKSYGPLDAETVVQLQAEGRLPSGSAEEFSTDQPEVINWLNNLDKQPVFTSSSSEIGGKPALSTATRLQRAPWIVITRRPLDLVNQPVQQQAQLSILLSLFIAILIAVVAIGTTQVISAPIVRLTKVAEQISKGDLSTRAQVETADEIGTLATTFNIMTDELSRTLMGLEKRIEERTRAIELSADISRRLSIILDPTQLVSEVVELLQFAFNYYHTQIYLFDEEHENLVMVGGTGEAGKIMLEHGHKLARGQGLVGRACETGIAVLVQDTHQDPQWVSNELLPDTNAEIAVPIILGDQVLGALDVQQNEIGALGQQDADLLLAVANQVAIALRNARQFAETQRNIAHQTQMNAIIQQIQNTTSVESALQVAAREIGRALNAPRTKTQLSLRQDSDGRN